MKKYKYVINSILIHYVCNAHFHWQWRRKFATLKSLRLCHENSDDVTSLATRRRNITKTFLKCVLSEEIRMVITRFVFEWFACRNCMILRSQIPVLPFRWRVAVKLNFDHKMLQFMPAISIETSTKILSLKLYVTPGLAPRMNVLFWGPGDFPVSYSNRDTSRNAWNRHSGSFMVDTGILFSNMKYPSNEY